jgi:hypothetical protein
MALKTKAKLIFQRRRILDLLAIPAGREPSDRAIDLPDKQ